MKNLQFLPTYLFNSTYGTHGNYYFNPETEAYKPGDDMDLMWEALSISRGTKVDFYKTLEELKEKRRITKNREEILNEI